MVSMCSGKPICAPVHISEVSPVLPFRQFLWLSDSLRSFLVLSRKIIEHCLIHCGPFLSFLGRLLSIVWFTMVLSRPFTQGYLALSDLLGAFLVLWRNLNSDDRFTEHCLIHYGPVLSFQRRLLSTLWFAVVLSHPFKEERWALSDSLWSFLILSRKNI